MRPKKNRFLFALVIIIGLIIAGSLIINKLLWINYLEVSQRRIVNTPSEVSKLLLKDLCNNPKSVIASYPEQGLPKVHECGDYYGVSSPENIADYPLTIINIQGTIVTQCGGLPHPNNPTPDPLCSIPCDEKDLCSGYFPW